MALVGYKFFESTGAKRNEVPDYRYRNLYRERKRWAMCKPLPDDVAYVPPHMNWEPAILYDSDYGVKRPLRWMEYFRKPWSKWE